jgi:hypothetical protein
MCQKRRMWLRSRCRGSREAGADKRKAGERNSYGWQPCRYETLLFDHNIPPKRDLLRAEQSRMPNMCSPLTDLLTTEQAPRMSDARSVFAPDRQGLSLQHRSARTLNAKSAGLPSKIYVDVVIPLSPFIGRRIRPNRSRVSDDKLLRCTLRFRVGS